MWWDIYWNAFFIISGSIYIYNGIYNSGKASNNTVVHNNLFYYHKQTIYGLDAETNLTSELL